MLMKSLLDEVRCNPLPVAVRPVRRRPCYAVVRYRVGACRRSERVGALHFVTFQFPRWA
jgi:hypothetical protein